MSNLPLIFSKEALKGFDFSFWGGIEGFLQASKSGQLGDVSALKRFVPDLAHAIDMTAAAISNLPFEIVPYERKQTEPKKAKEDDKQSKPEETEVFDSSKDWQNKLGGIPNPKRLIYLLASSLCGGSAYLIPWRTEKAIVDLQYAAPHTITPHITRDGLQYFSRASDQGETDRYKPKELIYFWLPDSDVEIGPALNHPIKNCEVDAQIIYNLKNTMREFGERNFTPITLLSVKGMPQQGEREKTEKWWNRLLSFGFKEKAKIINGENVTVEQISAGMEQLKQSFLEIRRDSKEGVGDSFGIPASMFMSDKAYASEMDVLMRQWYSDSRFVSIYQTIEEGLSDQLFKAYDFRLRFRPDTLDIFQEDENDRAASLSQLVTAISTDPEVAKWSMSVLGYDLTEEQETALDELTAKKEEEKKQEQEQAQAQLEQDGELRREEIASRERVGMSKPAPKSLTPDEMKDYTLWYTKACNWFAKGKGTAADWENKYLPETIAAPIRMKLASATSLDDIKAAFDIGETTITEAPNYDDPVRLLAINIERAIEAVKEDR